MDIALRRDPYTGWLMAYSEHAKAIQCPEFDSERRWHAAFGEGEGAVWMSGRGTGRGYKGNIFFLDANGGFDATLIVNGFPSTATLGTPS